MVLTVDGETVTSLEPVMGYLHRNHEKIGERNTYLHNIPFTDRLDYIFQYGQQPWLRACGRTVDEPWSEVQSTYISLRGSARIDGRVKPYRQSSLGDRLLG